jgi:hypothetical protein
MKKLFGILILFCILASCKTSKASCEAYGNNNTKKTDKDRSDDPRNVGSDSSYRTKK